MTQVIVKTATIEFLKKQPRFSTFYQDKSNGNTELFTTLEDAKKHYESIDVMDFRHRDNSYWRNNKEGQEAELRELLEIPVSLIEELNNCENEADMMEVYLYDDVHHTFANRIETKFSFLSDEWDENLGKGGEFVVKESKVPGITYGTHFGKVEMFKLSKIL